LKSISYLRAEQEISISVIEILLKQIKSIELKRFVNEFLIRTVVTNLLTFTLKKLMKLETKLLK
jgi:hypothetical protein